MAGAEGRASPSRRRPPSPSSPPPKRTRCDLVDDLSYPSHHHLGLDHGGDFLPSSAPISPPPYSPSDRPYTPSEPSGPAPLGSPSPDSSTHPPCEDDRESDGGCGGYSPGSPAPLYLSSPAFEVSYPRYEPTERDRRRLEEQRRAYAEKAIRRHNKNRGNKVKYALVEIAAASWFFEDDSFKFQVHLNLYVRAKNGPKKHGPPELAFAELWKGKALTSWHLLGAGQERFPGRRHPHRGFLGLGDREARDTRHCYACSDEMLHPEGSRYRKGHYLHRDYHPDY